MKKQKFDLYAPIFGDMRTELNEKLAQTVAGMEEKSIEEATITLKISLAMVERPVIMADNTVRAVRTPVISYKVQNAMKVVATESGIVDTGNMEMCGSPEQGYELRPVGVQQIGMDEGPEDAEEDGLILEALSDKYGIGEEAGK